MKYNITPTARGYEISATKNGHIVYLQSIYKGVAKWSLDYLYSRKYTTEAAARKVIETIRA